jgi:hypothetical protein
MFKKLTIIFSLYTCACSSQAQVWTKMLDSVPGFFFVRTTLKDTVNNVLYLGGEITAVNNRCYQGIIKYNNSSFDTLQNGVGSICENSATVINSLQFFQNKLYAFGNFTKTGKYNCKYIGRWNGSSWDSVNFKPNQPIWSSDVYNNELYVSGWFDTIGGIRSVNIAKFDGINWHDLSFPVSGATGAIKNYNSRLYAASYTGLWVYDNNSWSNLADCKGDMFRHIYGMNVIDGLLYIYGRFNSLGGVTSKGIVAFDGVKWYGFGQGMSYSGYEIINNVQKIDGKIYITGNFDKIEGIGTSNFTTTPSQSTNYAVLENNQWCLKSAAFDNASFGVVKYNGDLFIYGAFRRCGADTIFGFAKWSGGNSTVACSNTFTISQTYVGINEHIVFSDLKIYPNPVNDKLVITSNNFELQNFELQISNALGQTIYNLANLNNLNEIDLSHLSKGIYFVKIQNAQQQKTFKILKN